MPSGHGLDVTARIQFTKVARNNTTVAQNGMGAVLLADTFNIQAGFHWPGGDGPGLRASYGDGYIYLSPSQRFVVRITAPADAITSYGTITWSEDGKPGN